MTRGSSQLQGYDVGRILGGLRNQFLGIPAARRIQRGAFVPDGCNFQVRALMLGGFAQPAIKLGASGVVQVAGPAFNKPFAGFFVDLRVEFRSTRAFHWCAADLSQYLNDTVMP